MCFVNLYLHASYFKILFVIIKILFIGAHRLNRSPSQRFRFEQYIPYLEQSGIVCKLSPLLSESEDAIFYSKGNFIGKLITAFRAFRKRKKDLVEAEKFDLVFIQREAFMTGSTFFERALQKKKIKIVFDFDDAIWLPNISDNNKKYEWLKNSSKTSELISISDMVFAGNSFLADYALQYNKNVQTIPTTIDTDYHKKKIIKKDSRICIGWTGSHTTIQHFEQAVPFLKKLKLAFNDSIYFKVIGDPQYSNEALGIQGTKWTLDDEIEQLSEIDIGIMPLPNDEWAKGKCGLKGLQYMALEIPCIMSPVGVNTEIITDGVNGFLANSEEEWISKIAMLIRDSELRTKIGAAARKTVEEKYSVASQKEKYLKKLLDLNNNQY